MTAPSIFISADIEGISGYVDPEQDSDDSSRVRRAMTEEVNAVIEGILDVTQNASILVADAHGSKRNILHEQLHDRAALVRGGPRPWSMVDGITSDYDLAMFIGYHDKPGSGGHLEHVFTGRLADVRLNGSSVGEFELNARVVGAHGVPVGLVSGDDVLAETVGHFRSDIEVVTTKTARGTRSVVCRPAASVRDELRDRAADATARLDAFTPVTTESPCTIEVEYTSATLADIACRWPGVTRGDDSRCVQFEAADIFEGYRFVRGAKSVKH